MDAREKQEEFEADLAFWDCDSASMGAVEVIFIFYCFAGKVLPKLGNLGGPRG